MPAPLQPDRQRGVLVVTAAAAAWGMGTVASKGIIDRSVDPGVLLLVQLLAASAALAVAAVATGAMGPVLRSPGVLRLTAIGLIEPGAAAQFYTFGLALTAAGTATILFSTEPVVVVFLAWLFLGERPSGRLLGLCALAVAGMLAVLLPQGDGGTTSTPLGVALVAAGVLGAAGRSLLTSRALHRGRDPLPITFLHHVAGAVVALGVVGTQWVAGVTLEVPDTAGLWALAAASGLIQYALPFWLYLVGLRHLRLGVASQFLALIPVFGVTFSALVLGERLSPTQAVGGVVVLGALVGVARLPTEPPPNVTTGPPQP